MANAEREPKMRSGSGAPGQGVRGLPMKLKASVFQNCKWGAKLPIFCYLVNCSNMLFERILLHLARHGAKGRKIG